MKKIFLLFGIILIIVFSCGCERKNNSEIDFMTWGSKSEIDIMKSIIEDYNSSHEIKVNLVHVPQNYFQKLHLLFASNLAPDVIFINNLYLKIYQNAGLLEDLTPLVNKDDYFENALFALSADGKIYAVPRDVSSFVIFYNKALFKKAGIKENKNWDTEEFYQTAEALKNVSEYGFCTELEPVYWENFVSVENRPFISDGKVTVSEKTSVEALQNLSDKINKEKIGVNKEHLAVTPCAQLFLSQKTPIFVSGRWSIPKLDSQSQFEYGVLPFPKGKSKYYIPLNASGWAISKSSKNKTGAVDFVKYISSDENMEKMVSSGLITPAKKSSANSKNFKNGEVFINTINKSTPNIVPSDYNFIIDKINEKGKSVLEGYKQAEEVFGK